MMRGQSSTNATNYIIVYTRRVLLGVIVVLVGGRYSVYKVEFTRESRRDLLGKERIDKVSIYRCYAIPSI